MPDASSEHEKHAIRSDNFFRIRDVVESAAWLVYSRTLHDQAVGSTTFWIDAVCDVIRLAKELLSYYDKNPEPHSEEGLTLLAEASFAELNALHGDLFVEALFTSGARRPEGPPEIE